MDYERVITRRYNKHPVYIKKFTKQASILMEKLIIDVLWYEDQNGVIKIDKKSTRKEFEKELNRIVFLANLKP